MDNLNKDMENLMYFLFMEEEERKYKETQNKSNAANAVNLEKSQAGEKARG